MKFFAVAALFAAAASAQSDELCDGAAVLEACLETTKSQQNACLVDDFNCLCTAATSVFQCFGNAGCGSDPRASSFQNTMQSYCAYVTTTVAKVSTTASAENSEATTASTTSASSDSTTTPASEGSDDDTNSGAYLAMNAGGMLAAVAGVIAAVL